MLAHYGSRNVGKREICKLEASFQALNDSVTALITIRAETENDKYLLEKEHLRLEKERNVF